jgi:hypothetical protein
MGVVETAFKLFVRRTRHSLREGRTEEWMLKAAVIIGEKTIWRLCPDSGEAIF